MPEPPSGIEPVLQTGGVTMRNHPTVLVGQTVTYAIVLFVILLMSSSVGTRSLLVLCVLIALLFLYNLFVWRRTTYTFTDSELHVCRNLMVTKSDNYIHYTRLASVTVRRDIFNVIFGTSTLLFNVNTSVNAVQAEARLVLERSDADELRDRLNAWAFSAEVTREEEAAIETMIAVSNRDIVLNAILGQTTAQQAYGLLMLVYAVASLFYDSSGGFLLAVLLLVFGYVFPLAANIIRYYNYRVFRVGDRVTVESGFLTHTRRSFAIGKVNSVRVRTPLLARLLGRAVLEAEVVGIGDEDTRPLLCPLKRRAEVEDLLGRLMPELHFRAPEDSGGQPRSALPVMAISCLVATVLVAALFWALMSYVAPLMEGELSPFGRSLVVTFLVALPAIIVALLIVRVFLAQRHRAVCMGPESVLVVHGTYDLSYEYVNYDKVQYTEVTEGPLDRVFGVAHCDLHMMSAVGFRSLSTGLFEPEQLRRISDEVNARIADGRYDYRRYLRSIYQESGDLPKPFYSLSFRTAWARDSTWGSTPAPRASRSRCTTATWHAWRSPTA